MNRHDVDFVEIRRYIVALWKPAAALAAVAGATAGAIDRDALGHRLGEPAAGTRCLAGVGVVLGIWFAWALRRAVTQPRRDRCAAARLTDLHAAAQQRGCYLVEITQTQWATAAGQRVWAVDAARGGVADYWLPTSTPVPEGTFVLVRLPDRRPPEVLGHVPPRVVQAARRYTEASTRREQVRETRRRLERARAQDAAARDLIREAERITREP
jgi:hypothetical protein